MRSSTNRPGAFLLNRLLRLIPTYIVALCLSAIVLAYAFPSFVPAVNETPITPDRFAASTVLVNMLALFPIWKPIQSHWHVPEILEQGWALRIEFVFYLAAAAAVLAAGLIRTSAAAVLTAFGVAALLALAIMGGRAEGSFLENAPYFVFGVAFYYWLSHRPERALSGAFCLSACAFVSAQLLGRAATFGAAQVAVTAPVSCCFWPFSRWRSLLLAGVPEARGRRTHWFIQLDRWFGELTYPLYLTHWCVLIAAKAWLPHERWTSAICAFGAAYLLAVLAVLAVERPVATASDSGPTTPCAHRDRRGDDDRKPLSRCGRRFVGASHACSKKIPPYMRRELA